jgi:hypothetical protein
LTGESSLTLVRKATGVNSKSPGSDNGEEDPAVIEERKR